MTARTGAAAVIAAALLVGCTVHPVGVVGPADDLRVVAVEVEAAPAAVREPRGFGLAEADVERGLRAPVLALLDDANPGGTRPVTVDLTVTRLFVANPGSAVIGRSGSVAEARAQLTDARTGAAVGPPFDVAGGTGTRLGGLLGAAVTAGVLADGGEPGEIARVGAGLGRSLARAIYGIDPAAAGDS